jgi:hypothetical protein
MNDDILFKDAMKVSQGSQSNLARLVNKAEQLYNEIEVQEIALADAKDRYQRLITDELPQAMVDAQVSKLDTLDGLLHLERKQIVAGVWPKDEETQQKAVEWLVAEKAQDLIKCTVIINFDRGDREAAQALFDYAERLNSKRDVTMKETVHYQTLNAYFRERLQKGKSIPLELFNGFVNWIVEISSKEK